MASTYDVRYNERGLALLLSIGERTTTMCDTIKTPDLSLPDFQKLIRDMYVEKDKERGVAGTFMWLMEEVGELATALRSGTKKEQEEEFADVLAWLTTIANVVGVDLNKALIDKYGTGCPGCGKLVCVCPDSEKP